jgi:hypothetical protein
VAFMRSKSAELKIAVKYCGGCNPDYDHLGFVENLAELFKRDVTFPAQDIEDAKLVLVLIFMPKGLFGLVDILFDYLSKTTNSKAVNSVCF